MWHQCDIEKGVILAYFLIHSLSKFLVWRILARNWIPGNVLQQLLSWKKRISIIKTIFLPVISLISAGLVYCGNDPNGNKKTKMLDRRNWGCPKLFDITYQNGWIGSSQNGWIGSSQILWKVIIELNYLIVFNQKWFCICIRIW